MTEALKPGIDYVGITTPFYCNDGNGNFLLHKRGESARDEKGRWDFGSGQLDYGEEVEMGVLREVKEEWGVDGQIQEQIPAHSLLRDNEGVSTHWLAIPFFVEVDIDEAKIMEPHKFTEMGVFDLDHLPQPLHTGVKITMSRYPQYFDKYKKR